MVWWIFRTRGGSGPLVRWLTFGFAGMEYYCYYGRSVWVGQNFPIRFLLTRCRQYYVRVPNNIYWLENIWKSRSIWVVYQDFFGDASVGRLRNYRCRPHARTLIAKGALMPKQVSPYINKAKEEILSLQSLLRKLRQVKQQLNSQIRFTRHEYQEKARAIRVSKTTSFSRTVSYLLPRGSTVRRAQNDATSLSLNALASERDRKITELQTRRDVLDRDIISCQQHIAELRTFSQLVKLGASEEEIRSQLEVLRSHYSSP